MPPMVSVLLASVFTWFRSRLSMQMELIVLRHQLAVYKQSISRPRLRPTDRLLWVWLSRLWPGWQQALEFVPPRTVIAWQKKWFRDYWRRLSHGGKPGRPALSKEVREFIRDMWQSNPTRGSPRIVGELHKLGIDVAKSTVEKYRPHTRKPPSPTWKAFLTNHTSAWRPERRYLKSSIFRCYDKSGPTGGVFSGENLFGARLRRRADGDRVGGPTHGFAADRAPGAVSLHRDWGHCRGPLPEPSEEHRSCDGSPRLRVVCQVIKA